MRPWGNPTPIFCKHGRNSRHCKYPIHASILEGVNNKIKLAKRKAYGYRDLDYFALKVIQAFHSN